jgi:UPF0716 protein FxsA
MIPIILFVLFIGVPLLEIAAFIKIGEAIGVVPTLLGCVVTAVAGAILVRIQGFGVLRRAQAAMAQHQAPVDELAHGVMILVAGVLLMTPGYVTDTMGFLLLIAPVRLAIARAAFKALKDRAFVTVRRAAAPQSDGVTIEGEATDITDKKGGA